MSLLIRLVHDLAAAFLFLMFECGDQGAELGRIEAVTVRVGRRFGSPGSRLVLGLGLWSHDGLLIGVYAETNAAAPIRFHEVAGSGHPS
jgi:hypothetical protein